MSSKSTAALNTAMVRRLSGLVSFSAPTATATPAAPVSTAMHATWSAVDAEAHAFSTFMIGMPPNP